MKVRYIDGSHDPKKVYDVLQEYPRHYRTELGCHKKSRFEIVENNMEREYTVNEIYELGEDVEFTNGVNIYKFSGLRIEYKANDGWRETVKGIGYFLRTKFILVKKDKEVTFMDAIKAYEEGKIIYCDLDNKNHCNTYLNDGFKNIGGFDVKNTQDVPIGTREILKGKWFIKGLEG